MATLEARRKANQKYRETHRERVRYTTARRYAKSFVKYNERDGVEVDEVEYKRDLQALKKMIDKKLGEL